MVQFKVGETYETRSLCNHDCKISITVLSRTASTLTVKDDSGEIKKLRINKKISEFYGAEAVLPWGKYSMAPIINAMKENDYE